MVDAANKGPETVDDDKPLPITPVCRACKKLKVARSKRSDFVKKWYRDNAERKDEDDTEHGALSVAIDAAAAAKDAEMTDQNSIAESVQSVSPANPAEEQNSEGTSLGVTNSARKRSTEDVAAAAQRRAGIVVWEAHAQAKGGQEAVGETKYGETWQQEILRASEAHTVRLQAVEETLQTREASTVLERKRSAEATVEGRETKKQRVDLDLTIDDDNDLVEVKMEYARTAFPSPHADQVQQEDGQDIEAELKAVNLELREVQLERKKAELEQRLQDKRRRLGASKLVKTEKVIKIGD